VFQGTSLLTLDQKGRLSVPARHREALGLGTAQSVTVTRHPDGCLVIYPQALWEEKSRELSELPYAARAFVRFVLGSAVELPFDRAGRILIPAELRQMAGLTREVALLGVGGHFELWDRAALAEREREAFEKGMDAADFTF
jgi:MraZ protein